VKPLPFVIIMGVAGAGKTTLGRLLANRFGVDFFDADDFHSLDSRAKMSAGKALDDADRTPWLAELATLVEREIRRGKGGVLACSLLKERYRAQVMGSHQNVRLVFLSGSRETLTVRLQNRHGHFMPEALLTSQLESLEPPAIAIEIAVELDSKAQLEEVLHALGLSGQTP
jgi:gluconokinase